MVDLAGNRATLVLGLGNILLGDEGFGVHVVHRLKGVELPEHVRVEEGGVGGLNLLGHLEGVEQLLIVDVMMVDSPPGRLVLWKPGTNFRQSNKSAISFHQVSVMDLVHMWGLLGHEPELFFLVTRPQRMEPSMELSEPLRDAVEEAVNLIEKLCVSNFAGLERSKDS
jgi:hydrogenase maturation protease